MYQRWAVLLLLGLASCAAQKPSEGPAPGSQRVGDYSVEPERLSKACSVDKHGGLGQLTHRIFYNDRLVTEIAMNAFASPVNPSRMIYSVAPACGTEQETGAFYFAPSRQQPVQVSIGIISADAKFLNSLWSADDKFLALPANGMDFMLVDLETGKSANVSKRFYDHGSIISSVKFLGWSPDGKRLAIAILSTVMRPDGGMREQTDLVSVDPATLAESYIATMRRKDGWSSGEFSWVKKNAGFDLAVSSELQESMMVYSKARSGESLQAK